MIRLLGLAILLLLASCQSVQPYDENSRFYQVPADSRLILNKSITIEPNLARSYFQYGKQINKKNIEKYQPHCYLLLSTLSEQEQVIEPDTFVIHRVERDFISSASNQLYASLSMNGFNRTQIEYVNIYHLRSSKQPNVLSLNCLQWADTSDRFYLTVSEVRLALGDYFKLQLAGIESQ